jgi:hypothetical protein
MHWDGISGNGADGFVFWVDNSAAQNITGGNYTINGVIYMPNSALTYTGGNGTQETVLADTLTITGGNINTAAPSSNFTGGVEEAPPGPTWSNDGCWNHPDSFAVARFEARAWRQHARVGVVSTLVHLPVRGGLRLRILLPCADFRGKRGAGGGAVCGLAVESAGGQLGVPHRSQLIEGRIQRERHPYLYRFSPGRWSDVGYGRGWRNRLRGLGYLYHPAVDPYTRPVDEADHLHQECADASEGLNICSAEGRGAASPCWNSL